MSYRLTKIYTKKGDQGFTSIANKRLPKDDYLLEAVGTVDELNASIGLLLSFSIEDENIEQYLTQIQHDLFDLGGELHAANHIVITDATVKRLENILDELNETLPPLKEFILPRGNQAAAATHLARTIARRAERALVRHHRQTPLSNSFLIRYLNRLSDLLFVIARVLNKEKKEEEILWQHERHALSEGQNQKEGSSES